MTQQDLKASFDAVAQQYNDTRPSYPAQVLPLISNQLRAFDPLLLFEIGCGSGQATELFAQQQLTLIASDPSSALIAVAKQRLARFANVSFLIGAFEDLELPDNQFSIVLCAQAFHWVDAQRGIPKVYRILRPGGVVALMWNFIHYDATSLLGTLRDHFLTVVPAFAGWPDASEQRFAEFAASWQPILDQAPFTHYTEHRLTSAVSISTMQFRQLITTFSWFQTQSREQQAELLRGFDIVFADPFARVDIPWRTLLVLANKAAS